MLFVLWAIATILFFMFRLMPGDPIDRLSSTRTSPSEQRQLVLEQFGLDKPLSGAISHLPGNLAARRVRPVLPPAPAGARPPARGAAEHAAADADGADRRLCCSAALFGALARLEARQLFEAVAMPAGARDARRARFLDRHAAARRLRLRARLVPVGRRQFAGAAYASEWQRILSLDFLRHLALPRPDARHLPARPAGCC